MIVMRWVWGSVEVVGPFADAVRWLVIGILGY